LFLITYLRTIKLSLDAAQKSSWKLETVTVVPGISLDFEKATDALKEEGSIGDDALVKLRKLVRDNWLCIAKTNVV
jgi:hypothetical protein